MVEAIRYDNMLRLYKAGDEIIKILYCSLYLSKNLEHHCLVIFKLL